MKDLTFRKWLKRKENEDSFTGVLSRMSSRFLEEERGSGMAPRNSYEEWDRLLERHEADDMAFCALSYTWEIYEREVPSAIHHIEKET